MLSERDYLNLQATRAKARFRQTARTLADELLAPLQVRPFIQRNPWWSLGGAAAAGFVSSLVLFRGRAKAGSSQPRGKFRRGLATVSLRARRLLSSVVSAVVMANLRGGGRPAEATNPPAENGRGATGHDAVVSVPGRSAAPGVSR